MDPLNFTPKKVGKSPLYPLPPDYETLGEPEQRLARLNAIHYQKTPKDLVWAWTFFRTWYLRQTPPGFFYKRWVDSPDFHYQIVEDVGRYPYNAVAAPRASAKSTVLAIELPLLLTLTRPYFNILLIFSKDTMVTKRMNTSLGYQLQQNPYITADFGRIRPPKGQGVWNSHLMQLPNGASLEACSVMGGMLGARPDLILVDDPEIDPVMNRVTTELRENYERLLVNHILPMLDEGGSSLYWIGTLLSKQCFLYYAITTNSDKRFKFWNRRLLDAEDDGKGRLLWKAKWDDKTLEEDKERLGLAAYNAQRRNRPGSAGEQVLKIPAKLGIYNVFGEDPRGSPLDSAAVMVSHKKHDHTGLPVELERPFGPSVGKMFRILTMDYARCLSPTSDYVSMAVVGIENTRDYLNTWWLLDLFVGRLQGNDWVPRFWDLGLRWRVQYAGVEAVAAQETLVHTAQEYAETASAAEGWVPRVVPIRYPYGLSKEDRMGSLEWRFRAGKLKLPGHLKDTWPYTELWHEIMGFSGLPGATQHDDALDSIAMVQFLVKGGRRSMVDDYYGNSRSYAALEELSRGNTVMDGGLQVGLGVNASELPNETLQTLAGYHGNPEQDELPRRPKRCITMK